MNPAAGLGAAFGPDRDDTHKQEKAGRDRAQTSLALRAVALYNSAS